MKRLALLPLLAFVFACNDSQPLAPDNLAPQFSATGAPVQTASGSGHAKGIFFPNRHPGRIFGRTFAFNAKKWEDGTVTGQWERKRHFLGLESIRTSHGVVTCMEIIDGNTAYLGGYATSGFQSDPDAPGCTDDNFGYGCGNEVGWFVVDNGQGANNPPDVMSGQWTEFGSGFAVDFCENQEPLPNAFPVMAGNIKVNG